MTKKISISIITILLMLSFVITGFFILPLNVRAENTSATSMFAIESNSGRILYQHNSDKKMPMASTTKIVTAITVIENCNNLDKIVKVPAQAVGVEGSSIYLEFNEELSIRDLLYGLMLQSGNDCAVALAVNIGGSVEKFATLMNETSQKIGAKNSNFVNPHGLHNDKHYTTAHDLGIISAHAMKNLEFKTIVGTKKYNAPWANRDYNRVIVNKNKILHTFDGGNGIKTGFTKKAGRCLVSSAERNDMNVICVVFNCGPMFEECSRIMEKSFYEYKMTEVISDKDILGEGDIIGGKTNKFSYHCEKSLYYPMRKDESNLITKETIIDNNITAPLKYGNKIGKINISLNNQLLFSEKLFNIDSVDSLDVVDRLKDIIDNWSK